MSLQRSQTLALRDANANEEDEEEEEHIDLVSVLRGVKARASEREEYRADVPDLDGGVVRARTEVPRVR